MDPEGAWVIARGDDEFRRAAAGGWVHSPRVGAWRDLAVPGARDITLQELHGHRILDWRSDPTLDNGHWRLDGDVLHIRFGDAEQFSELSWARTPHRQRHPSLGTLCVFSAEQWERRRSTVIGMWAPELLRSDLRGRLAAAALDERAAVRDRRSAAGYRRALIRRGAMHFRLSHRDLSRAAKVSRGRVDQILHEAGRYGDAAAAGATSADEVLGQLALARSTHRQACERLEQARDLRAAAVREARREGLSFGQIALCLGISRGRVQQLARS
jgi:hypothetical protein